MSVGVEEVEEAVESSVVVVVGVAAGVSAAFAGFAVLHISQTLASDLFKNEHALQFHPSAAAPAPV